MSNFFGSIKKKTLLLYSPTTAERDQWDRRNDIDFYGFFGRLLNCPRQGWN